jgi:dATP pyrophosphohydrolase
VEETGLQDMRQLTDSGQSRVFTIDPRWRDRYDDDVTENTEHEWHYRLPSTTDIRLCDEEHSEFGWFKIEDAIDSVWSWTNKEALHCLKAKLR